MKNRIERARIAQETVAICARGEYVSRNGAQISIHSEIARAIEGTRLFRPGDLEQERSSADLKRATKFEVTGETTLGCAQRLAQQFQESHLCALNFASARHPGGGFLGGSLAQEESLAAS